MPIESMRRTSFLRTLALATVLLCAFQLITDFVEGIYAFGLLGTSIPAEIAAVALLLSPLLLIAFRERLPRPTLPALLGLMLTARLLGPLLDTRWRMIVMGVGVAALLLLLPAAVWERGQELGRPWHSDLGMAMPLALALSLLLRTLGSGFDLSLLGHLWWIGLLLVIVAAGAWVLDRRADDGEVAAARPAGASPSSGGSTAWVIGLSLGLMAVLALFYFVFTTPHVLSRWTGVGYGLVLPLAVAALVAYTWLLQPAGGIRRRLTPAWLMAWNGLFVAALVATALVHQVTFPASASSYPLAQPSPSWLQQVPLILTLLLYPVLLLDLSLLLDGIEAARATPRKLGAGFSLAALFLLVMIFAHVFTTVYDYIPVVGPLLRDNFWLVHLVVGLVVFASMLLVRRPALQAVEPAARPSYALAGTVTALAVAAVVAAVLVSAHPQAPSGEARTLSILTYNIQQGYSEEGQRNVDGQLALIEQVAPDIVGLQESDNARIAGGNADVVRYLADRLDMYSYYGPTTVVGTFGIALLSKYPIENPRTFYLFSEGEQVAVIEAQISVRDKTFHVFVTHLGNGGPIVQQEQLLTLVADKPDVIALGDFNFGPDSEQYRLTTTMLEDSWRVRWPEWTDAAGTRPDHKIDHIFVSPGSAVIEARVIESPASDHPAVTATLRW
jgi:endonuclease/exonuclease/phosphatase family metal-dependent hydrolase